MRSIQDIKIVNLFRCFQVLHPCDRFLVFRLLEHVLGVDGAAETDVGGDLGEQCGAVQDLPGILTRLDQGLRLQGYI